MKFSHEEYLKKVLDSKRLELEDVILQQRLSFAEFKVKKAMLREQIESIEFQLAGDKEEST